MSSFTGSITTADQLLLMPKENSRYELIKGQLGMMSPSGGRHGRVAMKLGQLLSNHVEAHQLGTVYAAETGFLLDRDPDTVRAPDTAFVAASRLARLSDDTGFIPLAPDLAAEIIPVSDDCVRRESDQREDGLRRAAFHPDTFNRLKDISPSDTFSEVESKALDWLRAGSRLVLLVDPETRTIHAYRSPTRIVVLMEGQYVDATDAVDGWRFSVDDLFE